MHSLKRLLLRSVRSYSSPLNSQLLTKPSPSSSIQKFPLSTAPRKSPPSSSSATGDDEWNDAWETAWLPEDLSANSRAPWESDVTFPSADAPSTAAAASSSSSSEIDADTKAFVAEMDERWNERRAATKKGKPSSVEDDQKNDGKKKKKAADEYRSKKQRIHAGLWMKEIEKMEESKLGNSTATGDDIDRLLDSCSEIFDSTDVDMNDSKIPSISDFKSKPDGWETTTRDKDGNIWEISQREEDILLQEFERRIAFSKFQIASFIKTHIFSRRRPIDGWKYMIEELGPNARKGKGSVQRLPSLADTSTQPFREEKPAISSNFTSSRR